jgi:magnesium chelatase family protein
MLSKLTSSAVLGIEAYPVEIETDLGSNLPGFVMVGLPDNAVRESRERVESAIKNSGLYFPLKRITVNLAPADIKKEGSAFDLPIALGILAADGQLAEPDFSRTAVLGELSLDGSLRPVRGSLPIAVAMRDAGFRRLVLPLQNAREAAIVEGIEVYPVENLRQACDFFGGRTALEPHRVDLKRIFSDSSVYQVDFSDVKGQDHVKRALEVAAAGGHNILMIGPPGSGKTMLARRLPTILPRMSLEEALETTKIHSVAGLLPSGSALVATRPFRTPHHTISDAGLIGGGAHPRPGEVSLAHHGVLFLDELPEFNKNVLEVMRQPLEDGRVTISRAAMSLTFPASFMLAAAMNPCPCGYYTDPNHECNCSPPSIQRYMSRVSGPLLDRIDIHIEVPALKYQDLSRREPGEGSAAIQSRVDRARDLQLERYRQRKNVFCNAHMQSREIRQHCSIEQDSEELLRSAINKFGLSARAYDRILKVSRTIADLEGAEAIGPDHIAEAIQYRSLDRNVWGQ